MIRSHVSSVLAAFLAALLSSAGCTPSTGGPAGRSPGAERPAVDAQAAARARMVDEQIRARGVRDEKVLAAMGKVPRHLFVPEALAGAAYGDEPLPIGYSQTISQPYIVARMTELAGLKGGETVLEVGTGSGYQAAVLAEIAARVFSIEIVGPLAVEATERLRRLGYSNIVVRQGDGYRGWPEEAPFDAIIVTAAPDHVPEPLVNELKVGGRLVIPVGDVSQELLTITKTENGTVTERVIPVRFVPMTGEAETAKKNEERE
jgi:protein-L-isoaspartate(D-aspartate) O-methyltransferase